MNEDALNLSTRKFLKEFGVRAQREIEQAVQAAMRDGTLSGTESLDVTSTLRLGALELEFRTDGVLKLS